MQARSPAWMRWPQPNSGKYKVYVDTLIAHDEQEPGPYADYPVGVYGLSERWLRCAWQHACGILLTA
jgi:hypothetical protein